MARKIAFLLGFSRVFAISALAAGLLSLRAEKA